METAYTNAAGETAGVGDFLNVGAGILTDLTLVPGTYTWGSTVTIPTDLTLNGSETDVWIFQIAGTLDMTAAKNVILSGGAQAKNIFWQVADAVTLGAGSHFEGNILAQTNIARITGATINGRLLAQTAVALQSNVVTVSF
ncbi:MAG: ice-binding family protein [Candidatus Taylorbacteria bacterium]|nr:ice-binding family protein [Candidatus Taylorbacteria bacterium]